MNEIGSNYKPDENNDLIIKNSNKILDDQKRKWIKIQSLIYNNVKEIFWKAWIKPLRFVKYENEILYLSAESKIITNRAETQYYETILIHSQNFFESLKKSSNSSSW